MEQELAIQGKAKDPVWVMADGDEPHVIGVRFDCGDGGVVYLTREQASSLATDLGKIAADLD